MGHSGTWPQFLPTTRLCWAAIIGLLVPVIAWAKSSDSDGIYGRLDGDITLSPNAGLEYSRGNALPTLGLRSSYLSTLGVSIIHADSRLLVSSGTMNRSVTNLDLEVRPLFLVRWTESFEVGPPLLDLTLDSFVIGIGAFWDSDRRMAQLRRGAAVSTGLGVPLIGRAKGPWLNATVALRFAEGPGFSAPLDVAYVLSLSWAFIVDSTLHNDDP
jgi:hypothetical protein